MSWLPKREKLDPKQTSAIDFAVVQNGGQRGSATVNFDRDFWALSKCAGFHPCAPAQGKRKQGE